MVTTIQRESAMPTATPFAEAQQIAQSGGCFVTPRNGRYLVYRKTPARVDYLGSRGTLDALRAFVRGLTATS